MSRAQLVQILDDVLEGKYDEDELHEYNHVQLANKFDLNDPEEVALLWYNLHAGDPGRCAYGLEDKNAVKFLSTVQEAIHQSFDGWAEEDKLVITAFLSDIAYATSQT